MLLLPAPNDHKARVDRHVQRIADAIRSGIDPDAIGIHLDAIGTGPDAPEDWPMLHKWLSRRNANGAHPRAGRSAAPSFHTMFDPRNAKSYTGWRAGACKRHGGGGRRFAKGPVRFRSFPVPRIQYVARIKTGSGRFKLVPIGAEKERELSIESAATSIMLAFSLPSDASLHAADIVATADRHAYTLPILSSGMLRRFNGAAVSV